MRTGEECPRCGKSLVEIEVASGDGLVVLQSCSNCDGRWWRVDGHSASLGDVLTRVRPVRARR